MNEVQQSLERRLLGFFLARIRRLAIFDLYAEAKQRGMLEAEPIDGDRAGGTVWRASAALAERLTGNIEQDRRTIARLMKVSPTGADRTDHLSWFNTASTAENRQPESPTLEAFRLLAGEDEKTHDEAATRLVLPIIRSCLPLPDVSNVGVALLVARAAAQSGNTMLQISQALSIPRPSVLIKAPVGGFEKHITASLEEGLIMPFWASLLDLLNNLAFIDRHGVIRPGKKRRKMVFGSGREIAETKQIELRQRVAKTLSVEEGPVVIADERDTALYNCLVNTVDLVLECDGFDAAMLVDILHLCVGIPKAMSSAMLHNRQLDLTRLHIDDLVMAIRPGRSLDAIIFGLETLLAPYEKDEVLNDGDGRGTNKHRAGSNKKPTHTVEIVQPKPLEHLAAESEGFAAQTPPSSKPPLLVERLTGYGDAKIWALDLDQDLEEWRAGSIGWQEMSTKLLLSGAPGTGKTTFARALCNSLQVPLVVSSVTSWLEPGYLGDVLQRMSAAFKTAREHAPCIMLIDEIDGIGSRTNAGRGGKQYDDYWTSLINRLLELLDGALKSEGVIIIAATNHPDRIDPALLRSGRLEKHIAIALPDIDALTGILTHHLGADLADVLASARPNNRMVRLRPRPGRDSVPLKRRGPSDSSTKPKEGPRHD